jgi:hypothetical protein
MTPDLLTITPILPDWVMCQQNVHRDEATGTLGSYCSQGAVTYSWFCGGSSDSLHLCFLWPDWILAKQRLSALPRSLGTCLVYLEGLSEKSLTESLWNLS